MQSKFVLLYTSCLFFTLIIFIGCKSQFPGRGTTGTLTFDTARAAGSVITITQARQLQRNFTASRSRVRNALQDTSFLTKNFNIPNGEAFTRDALLLLLSQKEADGIRIYYGQDNTGVVRLVLLPIRKNGSIIRNKLLSSGRPLSLRSDSLSRPNVADAQLQAEAVETGQTCPPCIID